MNEPKQNYGQLQLCYSLSNGTGFAQIESRGAIYYYLHCISALHVSAVFFFLLLKVEVPSKANHSHALKIL